MTAETRGVVLLPAGEEAWRTLHRHVQWGQRFQLLFLFGSHRGVIALFAARLEAACRAQTVPMQRFSPDTAEQAALGFLDLIRAADPTHDRVRSPFWADFVTPIPGEPKAREPWFAALDNMLARLNEHRELLRTQFRRPVVLVLPGEYRQRAGALAPDLWSIRDGSADLTGPDIVDSSGPMATGSAIELAMPIQGRPERKAGFLDDPQWREWLRLQGMPAVGRREKRNFMVAAGNAAKVAMDAGRLDDAMEAARRSVLLARSLLAESPAPDRSLAVRDLAGMLIRIGDVARAQGRWAEAEGLYRESLVLRRQLLEQTGRTSDVMRELSVSLSRMGDAARALGRWTEADAAYRESLVLVRELRGLTGEAPETLRDLGVLLIMVGDVAYAQGWLAEAEAAYRESLGLMRAQREGVGDAPRAVRDLSVSLERVGDVTGAQGRWNEAEAAYRESLQLHERLALAVPELGDVQREVQQSRAKLEACLARQGAQSTA
jgi:tetratricopeptide (TPR) repeat protein